MNSMTTSTHQKKIIIPKGNYSLEDLEGLIKKHITDFSLKLKDDDNKIQFQLPISTRMTFTKNLLALLGFSKAFEGSWFSLGPHFGKMGIKNREIQNKALYLYCKQLCKSTHLIDGKYTNCLYATPILVKQTVIFHSPAAKLIYLPVEYPTRYLEFEILDQNDVKVEVKNITLQILNKHE